MAVDAWLVRASPCKSKYVVNFISVALENRVKFGIYESSGDEGEKRDGVEVCFFLYPLSPSLLDGKLDQAWENSWSNYGILM